MIEIIEQFARSGGGGSGGSGGSGGDAIVLIGYGLGYIICKPIKKFVNTKYALKVSIVAMSIATIAMISMLGFGSLLGSVLMWYIEIGILVGMWAAWYAIMYGVWGKLNKRFKKADKKIAEAAQKDGIWQENKMLEHAQNAFMRFQQDWTTQDTSKLLEYMTPWFADKTYLMLRILHDMNRQNAVLSPKILNINTVDINDATDNNLDTFTVAINAQADDQLLEIDSRKLLFRDSKAFVEYWTFQRAGNDWLLSDIQQETQENESQIAQVKNFAEGNNFHYTLDMGWLFLPQRGQVFVSGSFGVSDINNHVVGLYGNLLFQLYTYISVPKSDTTKYTFIIGQITVPKNYGSILIRPKQGGLTNFMNINSVANVNPVDGSAKYNFEWGDFNNKYEVFSTNADRLASFELVNPKFMEMMYAIDEKMVLEVVDNNIYFRISSKVKDPQTYFALLELLKQAHKELKL